MSKSGDQSSPPSIRVLIVDESAVSRYLLTEILGQSDDIEVIAALHHDMDLLDRIVSLRPDVITLDIAMTKTDGLNFLEKLINKYTAPVVIISALTQRGSGNAIKALEIGAVDYVPKQAVFPWGGVLGVADEIINKVRAASEKQLSVSESHFIEPQQINPAIS